MHRIDQIAAALSASFDGDGALLIARAAEPATANPDDLAVALTPAFLADLGRGSARAALVSPGTDWRAIGLDAAIFAPRGRLAMARLTQLFDQAPEDCAIHPTALVPDNARIGAGVTIGAYSVIGAGSAIGDGTRIGPHVTLAPGTTIGAECDIRAGCRIGPRTRIGARAILHPNVVIAADGFSFVTEQASAAETARATLGQGGGTPGTDPTWHRIHSLGGVEIGDDVEIGANASVDAGTLRATRIGRGTKIDALVQIGHNAVVGAHCLLCAQVGVAGSAVIGDRCVLGGKAGVADNLTLGADVVLGGGTIVLSNVPAGRVMLGYPATRMDAQIESYKALRRLPRLLSRLAGGTSRVPSDDPTD